MNKPYLNYLKFVAIVLLFGCYSACATISASRGTQGTDLTGIQIGANRVTIEKILGDPIEVRQESGNIVATYTFNREDPPQNPDAGLIAEVLFLPWQPVIWAVVADSREKKKGRLKITYGPEDTIVALDASLLEARQKKLLSLWMRGLSDK